MFYRIMVLGFVICQNLMLLAIRMIWMTQVKIKRKMKWNAIPHIYTYIILFNTIKKIYNK